MWYPLNRFGPHIEPIQPIQLLSGTALNDGDPAGVAVLVAKPFKDPLRGMPLLLRSTFIRRQDPSMIPVERIELRTRQRPLPPVPGRHRKRQHLRNRPRIDSETPRRFPPAHTFNLYRVTNLPSSPGPCRFPTKAICCRIFTPAQPDYPAASVRDFCSGAYTLVSLIVIPPVTISILECYGSSAATSCEEARERSQCQIKSSECAAVSADREAVVDGERFYLVN